ncbi:MAG: type II 3-dehydroquinate dehydratase [Myxococcota bacterium]
MAKKKAKPFRFAVLNGPNLNLLGTREPELYGSDTLESIEERLEELADELGVELHCFQSNHEGALVDELHRLRGHCDGLILNAAGLTHTSVVLRDALLAVQIRFIEVHLSNVFAREEFRHDSLLSDIAIGVISGFGAFSYELALGALMHTRA